MSIGNEKVEMNDYVGKQLNQVISIISEEFKDVKIIEELFKSPEGTIIGQDPSSGRRNCS